MEPTTSKSYGAVTASVIIILVLIVGALYFWNKTVDLKVAQNPANTQEQQVATTSNDSIDSLKADIQTGDQGLKNVDAGLKGI